ncbi:conserved hypothetical protein (plasmid) [Borreliella burgdorferi 156a]|nr:conserved hypothetical protein [Borreliella burgdorferi 156a]
MITIPKSIIYYEINCSLEKISLKLQDYYQSLSDRLKQPLQEKNLTTILL